MNLNEEIIDEFETIEGVRQGCPLSADLFNVVMSDMKKEMKKTTYKEEELILARKGSAQCHTRTI